MTGKEETLFISGHKVSGVLKHPKPRKRYRKVLGCQGWGTITTYERYCYELGSDESDRRRRIEDSTLAALRAAGCVIYTEAPPRAPKCWSVSSPRVRLLWR